MTVKRSLTVRGYVLLFIVSANLVVQGFLAQKVLFWISLWMILWAMFHMYFFTHFVLDGSPRLTKLVKA